MLRAYFINQQNSDLKTCDFLKLWVGNCDLFNLGCIGFHHVKFVNVSSTDKFKTDIVIIKQLLL